MGAIISIGADMLGTVQTATTLTEAAGFLIVALAAIFLMSQVPTMVNGLAGTVVATGTGARQAMRMAAMASGVGGAVGGAVAGAARTATPALRAGANAVRAGAQAPAGQGASVGMQELVNTYQARKAAIEGNEKRMAHLGKRTTMAQDFEAGQAGMDQYAKRRSRALRAARSDGASETGRSSRQG